MQNVFAPSYASVKLKDPQWIGPTSALPAAIQKLEFIRPLLSPEAAFHLGDNLMATPAQIAANRANAQHSTGPRTDAGKLRASQNALRHGLCAGIPIMHDEGDQNEDQLLDALREEYQPLGPTEEILVYKMAEHFFYAKRAAYLLSEQLDSNDHGDNNAREIGLMMRYHAASDRGYYRALTELRKVQKERRCPRVQPDATTYPPSDAQRDATTYPSNQPRAMERDRSIGSVSQPAETTSSDLAEIGSVSPNVTPEPAAQAAFAPENPVSVTSPREDNRTTDPPNPTRASSEAA
jgi:hypothetical protein